MDESNQVDLSSNEPPQKQKGVITFGSQKPKGPSLEITNLTSQVGELGRRLRIIEDRYSNVRRKTQVTDQNMLNIQKNLNREVKAVDDQIIELQKSVSQLNDKMKQILREIQNFAKNEDVRTLKRYLDFWQPLNFITKIEAEKLVNDIINRKI